MGERVFRMQAQMSIRLSAEDRTALLDAAARTGLSAQAIARFGINQALRLPDQALAIKVAPFEGAMTENGKQLARHEREKRKDADAQKRVRRLLDSLEAG